MFNFSIISIGILYVNIFELLVFLQFYSQLIV